MMMIKSESQRSERSERRSERSERSESVSDQCTSIAISSYAMIDTTAIITHNDDCNECDIRITHIPSFQWMNDTFRPVFMTRPSYPRYLETKEYNIHGSAYLIGTEDRDIYEWEAMTPVFYIPQVPHTYAYTLGNYPLQNEKQLSMGESTCAARFYTTSAYSVKNKGKAKMDINTLMEVAMERCADAVCAIKLMGSLAVEYGFFGSDPGPHGGGEAVTLADNSGAAWVFHISADDTGTSAVWVAQRVPDGELAVVPNQFIIQEIDLDDTDNFLASENIYKVAERAKIWNKHSGKPFNYLHVYGFDYGSDGYMCTRRTWRIFSLAAPSLSISPFTDSYASFGFGPHGREPYPFSVKPDKKLTLSDVMAMTRDTYEGTQFDLSTGLAAGVFGDVMRYEAMPSFIDSKNGILYPNETSTALRFERAISLYRTVYASIAQARPNLPDVIGAVVWIAPYAPHHSSYVPVYVSPDSTPSSVSTGTQYKLHKDSNYWVHSVVGNYLSRWYKYTIGDVRSLQRNIETEIFAQQSVVEEKALRILNKRASKDNKSNDTKEDNSHRALHDKTSLSEVSELLGEFHENAAAKVRDEWWEFFWQSVGKFRDQMIVVDPHAPTYPAAIRWMMYPRWWLESIGFWGAPFTPAPGRGAAEPVTPNGYPTLSSPAEYDAAYPNGIGSPYRNTCFQEPVPTTTWAPFWLVLLGFLAGLICTVVANRFYPSMKSGYMPVDDGISMSNA